MIWTYLSADKQHCQLECFPVDWSETCRRIRVWSAAFGWWFDILPVGLETARRLHWQKPVVESASSSCGGFPWVSPCLSVWLNERQYTCIILIYLIGWSLVTAQLWFVENSMNTCSDDTFAPRMISRFLYSGINQLTNSIDPFEFIQTRLLIISCNPTGPFQAADHSQTLVPILDTTKLDYVAQFFFLLSTFCGCQLHTRTSTLIC